MSMGRTQQTSYRKAKCTNSQNKEEQTNHTHGGARAWTLSKDNTYTISAPTPSSSNDPDSQRQRGRNSCKRRRPEPVTATSQFHFSHSTEYFCSRPPQKSENPPETL